MRLPGEEELVCGQRGQGLHFYEGPALSGLTSHWNKHSDNQQSSGETAVKADRITTNRNHNRSGMIKRFADGTKAVLYADIWEFKFTSFCRHTRACDLSKSDNKRRSQVCRTLMHSERRSITSILRFLASIRSVSWSRRGQRPSWGSRLTIFQSRKAASRMVIIARTNMTSNGVFWVWTQEEKIKIKKTREKLRKRFTSLLETKGDSTWTNSHHK